ncbi:hypothetical protein Tco_1388531 [Tanacetum coccineum]
MSSDPNYEWEQLLDIDDSDLPLTPVLRPCNSHVRETTTTTTTQNVVVRIIPGPAGIVQVAKLRKQSDIHEGEDDEDFKGESWVSAVEFLNANGGGIVNGRLGDSENYLKDEKLEQVVAIIKSCTPNALSDLTMTLKDLSVSGNGSGVGGNGLLMEEKEIVKLMEQEEMDDLELHVCGNVIDQEDLYKFDEEALDLALEEEARQARAH